jgi:hypothetical protein
MMKAAKSLILRGGACGGTWWREALRKCVNATSATCNATCKKLGFIGFFGGSATSATSQIGSSGKGGVFGVTAGDRLTPKPDPRNPQTAFMEKN